MENGQQGSVLADPHSSKIGPSSDRSGEVSLESLLEITPEDGRDLVRAAYDLSLNLHHGQTRSSGQPYISHPLTVATYLAELNMDAGSIAAGLLHDVLEDTEISREELEEKFPSPIPEIVRGVTKISKINFQTNREAQVENLRIMILAMAKDIRVVIVKLCDRLHNMQTLEHLPSDKRVKISRETMDIYAPLANRLGISRIRSELEDLSMRWLYPQEYQELVQLVSMKKEERAQIVQESIRMLGDMLKQHYGSGNDLEITGRPKHFWSIFRKMDRQGLTFEQIYDLNAMRVLCENEAQCYEILGLIHAMWPPVPGRIKDYIGMPKKNMYQSLHTTVMGYKGNVTEIQIRTKRMHNVAEYGIAAHWKYKEGATSIQLDDKLAWLRQLTEWITDVNEPDHLLASLKKDVFADRVMCFTPAGDVVELPADACPIDFAYAIHTKVGEQCVGAKINNRMVNLRSRLHNGDIVEILTSKNGHPSRDWLEYAVTGRARSKIKHWLKARNLEEWAENGRKALWKVIEDRNLEITKDQLDKGLERLLDAFKMQNSEELLVEIGFGSISPQAALARMNPDWAKRTPQNKVRRISDKDKREHRPITVDGLEDSQLKVARCCAPLPGDPIVGFVTRGRGVTIHKQTCANIIRAKNDIQEAERLHPARWTNQGSQENEVRIRVEARDREGLLNDLTGIFRNQNIFILSCTTKSNENRRSAALEFIVKVSDSRQLNDTLEHLRAVNGVESAERRRS